jgi:GTP-binding protein HflX
VDRRDIRRRIDHLKNELEKVRIHRQQYRQRRQRSRIPIVTLVGYTNAGKSTLLNKLTQANVYVADQLFATLDPTTRRVELPGGNPALFTDTVGFIQKLPTAVVAAFRATLEEIGEADLLLHLVDITHSNARAQAEAVYQTLVEIGANHIPILIVLNKIDRLDNPENVLQLMDGFPKSVAISALTGEGISNLLSMVDKHLFEMYTPIDVFIPYRQGDLISIFHDVGQVERVEQTRSGVEIRGKLPGRLIARFQPYVIDRQKSDSETGVEA